MKLNEHLETYKNANPILVAVDNVIFGFDHYKERLKVLLFQRQVEPEAGAWSLIGSFVQENESAPVAAMRILKKFTGLSDVFLEQLKVYSTVNRDPGARVISISYYSLLRIDKEMNELTDAYNAKWFYLDQVPKLAIDHNSMVEDALIVVQEHARRKPIGFNLLPEKFTLPKLLKLYKEIYREPLDDRNFRKKILSLGILERLDEKDKTTSKKGAYLYQFDKEKYFEMVENGYQVQFL